MCKDINNELNAAVQNGINVSNLTDFEKVKDSICYKLVNTEANSAILKEVPHIDKLDLSVVFYILISEQDDGGIVTAMIKDSLAEAWGRSAEELFELAKENTPKHFKGSVRDMMSVLGDLTGYIDSTDVEIEVSDCPMYVCSNKQCMNGASAVLYDGLLEEFSKTVGNDLYVLPSSIHEMILVPVNDRFDPDELRAMVSEINTTQVAPDEVLSDNVYIYRRGADGIAVA